MNFQKLLEKRLDNSVALSYLKHGDFWSKGKSNIFLIDSSWIPNVETSVKWYDKVIKEFPNSVAANVAYQDKIQTILGWKESGKYGDSHGIKKSFNGYIGLLLNTFESFEKEFPVSSSLQGIRYQIAQVYWNQKDWEKTREWLNTIIKKTGEGDSFYKDLAERRLLKIEY